MPRLKIRGEWYSPIVLRVVSRKENGTPENLTLIGYDDTAELSTDTTKNHFIVAFAPETDYSKHAGEIPTLDE